MHSQYSLLKIQQLSTLNTQKKDLLARPVLELQSFDETDALDHSATWVYETGLSYYIYKQLSFKCKGPTTTYYSHSSKSLSATINLAIFTKALS